MARGVHVGRGRDAPGAALPHAVEEETLAPHEDVEAGPGEGVEHGLGVSEVARAVLHAHHGARVGAEEALHELRGEAHLRHRRESGRGTASVDRRPPVRSPRRRSGRARPPPRPCNRRAGASRTPAQPRRTACAVSRTASVSEQAPVPGRRRSAGTPSSRMASRRLSRSSTESEFPSLVVPKGASAAHPCARSQRQCRASRRASGERSAWNGVSTGARTPRRRPASLRREVVSLI